MRRHQRRRGSVLLGTGILWAALVLAGLAARAHKCGTCALYDAWSLTPGPAIARLIAQWRAAGQAAAVPPSPHHHHQGDKNAATQDDRP
jgi:hypothetical protein